MVLIVSYFIDHALYEWSVNILYNINEQRRFTVAHRNDKCTMWRLGISVQQYTIL